MKLKYLYTNNISGNGKKNSVSKTEEKHAGKTSAAIFTPTAPTHLRNLTNASAAVAGFPAGTLSVLDGSNVTQSSALDDAHLQRTLLKPKFLTENSSTVVAQTGASSRISCLVANLGDCVVSSNVLACIIHKYMSLI